MALSDSGWQQLRPIPQQACPKLFYNFTLASLDFELFLTDLIGLWSCKRSEEQIIDEAKRLKTSIDPSESKGQLEILLSKLQQSLSQGETLFKRHGKNESIVIQTELSLPKPLKPLIWMFHLEPLGAAAMAEQILRPCLHEASESRRRLASLEEVITTKDNVIEKLLDRINASSTDLSVIFPGITGLRTKKGHVTSKDAQRHVPGLGRFNTEAWSKQFETDGRDEQFTSSGLSTLMAGCEACPKHTAQEHENWLHNLPKISEKEFEDWTGGNVSPSKLRATMLKDPNVKAANAESKDESSMRPVKLTNTPYNGDSSEDTTSVEDDFETRRGPPKLKRKRSANDNLSDSEEEEPGRKKSKLGGLRQQQTSSSRNRPKSRTNASTARSKHSDRSSSEEEVASTASESPAPNKNSNLNKLGRGRKASNINEDIAVTPSSSPLPPQPSSLPSTPRKLGRLKNSSSAAPSPTSEPPLSTPRRRLGRLGSKEPGQSQQDERSASGTPSRALGRLGGKSQTSQKLNPVEESSEDSEAGAKTAVSSQRRNGTRKRDDEQSTSTDSDTDIKTNPRRKQDEDRKQGSSPPPPPPAGVQAAREESVTQETAAEKAQRRREELKKKIDPGMAVRRKRKF